ncbi:nematode fatty acid retinoid binding protein [Necator americanus]|uniref:Fatty-acid and retinol-binding protein 1 n=1 Tax=Necator americanus TaxID=51031 RepID=W2SPM6_NECAM|nr:nematode fatty acid retinoid binding protein [Necator americanus]ETN71478.1 nematode fatty acid retinoid binding protein [Necator americanus]
MRKVVIASVFVLLTAASAFNVTDIPQEYRDLIPKEVLDFIASLTESDKSALKEIYEKFATYKSENEVTEALNKKSPGLAEKLQKFQDSIRVKLDALGTEAKTFAKEIFANARDIREEYFAGSRPSREQLMERTLNTINKYQAMSDAGKADFQRQFPIFAKVFSNEKLAKFLENEKLGKGVGAKSLMNHEVS